MRELVRYEHVDVLIRASPDNAAPKVAGRDPGLPKALKPAEVMAPLRAVG